MSFLPNELHCTPFSRALRTLFSQSNRWLRTSRISFEHLSRPQFLLRYEVLSVLLASRSNFQFSRPSFCKYCHFYSSGGSVDSRCQNGLMLRGFLLISVGCAMSYRGVWSMFRYRIRTDWQTKIACRNVNKTTGLLTVNSSCAPLSHTLCLHRHNVIWLTWLIKNDWDDKAHGGGMNPNTRLLPPSALVHQYF